MAQVTYLGPSDSFTVGGKTYHKGDKVNLAEDVIKHHAKHGHMFKKGDEVVPTPATKAQEPVENKSA